MMQTLSKAISRIHATKGSSVENAELSWQLQEPGRMLLFLPQNHTRNKRKDNIYGMFRLQIM